MNINLNDESLTVRYIQKFLKDNFDENTRISGIYDKATHKQLIKYLQTTESIPFNELLQNTLTSEHAFTHYTYGIKEGSEKSEPYIDKDGWAFNTCYERIETTREKFVYKDKGGRDAEIEGHKYKHLDTGADDYNLITLNWDGITDYFDEFGWEVEMDKNDDNEFIIIVTPNKVPNIIPRQDLLCMVNLAGLDCVDNYFLKKGKEYDREIFKYNRIPKRYVHDLWYDNGTEKILIKLSQVIGNITVHESSGEEISSSYRVIKSTDSESGRIYIEFDEDPDDKDYYLHFSYVLQEGGLSIESEDNYFKIGATDSVYVSTKIIDLSINMEPKLFYTSIFGGEPSQLSYETDFLYYWAYDSSGDSDNPNYIVFELTGDYEQNPDATDYSNKFSFQYYSTSKTFEDGTFQNGDCGRKRAFSKTLHNHLTDTELFSTDAFRIEYDEESVSSPKRYIVSRQTPGYQIEDGETRCILYFDDKYPLAKTIYVNYDYYLENGSVQPWLNESNTLLEYCIVQTKADGYVDRTKNTVNGFNLIVQDIQKTKVTIEEYNDGKNYMQLYYSTKKDPDGKWYVNGGIIPVLTDPTEEQKKTDSIGFYISKGDEIFEDGQTISIKIYPDLRKTYYINDIKGDKIYMMSHGYDFNTKNIRLGYSTTGVGRENAKEHSITDLIYPGYNVYGNFGTVYFKDFSIDEEYELDKEKTIQNKPYYVEDVEFIPKSLGGVNSIKISFDRKYIKELSETEPKDISVTVYFKSSITDEEREINASPLHPVKIEPEDHYGFRHNEIKLYRVPEEAKSIFVETVRNSGQGNSFDMETFFYYGDVNNDGKVQTQYTEAGTDPENSKDLIMATNKGTDCTAYDKCSLLATRTFNVSFEPSLYETNLNSKEISANVMKELHGNEIEIHSAEPQENLNGSDIYLAELPFDSSEEGFEEAEALVDLMNINYGDEQFLVHSKLLDYIFEMAITKYSSEDEIMYAKELLNGVTITYTPPGVGTTSVTKTFVEDLFNTEYDDAFKEDVRTFQIAKGVKFVTGYVDVETLRLLRMIKEGIE